MKCLEPFHENASYLRISINVAWLSQLKIEINEELFETVSWKCQLFFLAMRLTDRLFMHEFCYIILHSPFIHLIFYSITHLLILPSYKFASRTWAFFLYSFFVGILLQWLVVFASSFVSIVRSVSLVPFRALSCLFRSLLSLFFRLWSSLPWPSAFLPFHCPPALLPSLRSVLFRCLCSSLLSLYDQRLLLVHVRECSKVYAYKVNHLRRITRKKWQSLSSYPKLFTIFSNSESIKKPSFNSDWRS